MTIQDAIDKAKKEKKWFDVPPLEPAKVVLTYNTDKNILGFVELDLMNEDKETELACLWDSLHKEIGAAGPESVISVDLYCV